MKKLPSLKSTGVALGLLLCAGALHADTIIPGPAGGNWGEYDYNRYLYGSANGSLVLSEKSSDGFKATINSNFVDVVNNSTGEIGPDGTGEGPQGRPAIFYEFPEVDLSQNGQKITCTYNIRFNTPMRIQDQFIRFGFINTNNNNSIYTKTDSGGTASGGTSSGARTDGTTTDMTGFTLWDLTSTPAYPWTYTVGGYSGSPTLTNINSPLDPIGPSLGYVRGIYSHCFSSGGNGNSGSDISGYPNGVGFGGWDTGLPPFTDYSVDAAPTPLDNITNMHYMKYSLERRVDALAGVNGVKCQWAWTNDAGSQILKSGEHASPYLTDFAFIGIVNKAPLTNISAVAWNIMQNAPFPLSSANPTGSGNYEVRNVRIIYEWLRFTSQTYNPGTDSLSLVWSSTPYNLDTGVSDNSVQYTLQSTTNLTEDPITWTDVAANIQSQGDYTTNVINSVSTSANTYYRVWKQAP